MDFSTKTGTTSGGTSSVPSCAWKSAYGVIAAMAITIPMGIGFFLYEGVFALLSDMGALLVGVLLAPLVWCVYLLNDEAPYNRVVFGVGVVTVAGICLGSLGLVVTYVSTLPPEVFGTPFLGVQFLGWFLLGFWLLGVGGLGRRTGSIGERTAWTAIVAGIGTAGGMVALVYSYAVESFTLLFPLFMIVFVFGFLFWAFWFARELRRNSSRRENPTTAPAE